MAESGNQKSSASRGPATALLLAMEACVLFLVVVSPWLLGANDPWAFGLLAWPLGIALLSWASLAIHTGRLGICLCPIGVCLVLLILITLLQLVPLPVEILQLVSPSAVALRNECVPIEPETLADGSTVAMPKPWQPISLDPGATRIFLSHLASITLLYLMVRSNLARQVLLLRLGWVLLVNGAALAFFAIAQSLTSANNDTVYWTWITPGAVFGPFICRNHYPDYINLCVGAVLGVVGWTYHQKVAPRSRDGFLKKAEFWRPIQEIISSPLELFNKPATLLCIFAMALMVATIPMSMSRGGSVALLSSIILTSIAWISAGTSRLKKVKEGEAGGTRNLALVLWIALPVIGLIAWFGWDAIGKRLGTITDKKLIQEDRVSVWTPLLTLVRDYPVVGTGAGTMGVVEPMVRKIGGYPGVVLDHAHNEYLEALVEGGIPRLAVTVLMVFWMVRMGMRGIRRHRGEPSALMPAGLLFGLLALAIHSTVDFGVHMGAVALLATVCMAHLSALSRHTTDRAESRDHEETNVWILEGLPARLGGCVLAVWALLLTNDLVTGSTVFRLQMEADQQPVTNAGQERRIELLESALRLRPWLPEIHETIGLAALDMVAAQDSNNKALKRDLKQDLLNLEIKAGIFLDLHCGPFKGSFPWMGVVEYLGAQVPVSNADKDGVDKYWQEVAKLLGSQLPSVNSDKEWYDTYWNLGLSELAKSRALSPVYRRTHAYLGLFAEKFAKSEPASVHLYRAAKVYSFDPDLWFSAGLASWLDGDKATGPDAAKRRANDQYIAAVRWQRSLERSTFHMPEILAKSLTGEDPEKLLDLLIPNDPNVLLEAIRIYQVEEGRRDPRPVLLDTARNELMKQGLSASGATWRVLAGLQQKLGLPEARILESLRQATDLTPPAQRPSVAMELIRRLEENGLISEANRRLGQVLEKEPDNKAGREMQRFLQRDLDLEQYLDLPPADLLPRS